MSVNLLGNWPSRAAAGALLLAMSTAAHGQDQSARVRSWLRHGTRSVGTGYPAMGMIPSPDEDFAKAPHFRVIPFKRGLRPRQVLLTDFLPPVANQGRQGSCVGWSSAYYSYSYGVARDLQLTPDQLAEDRFRFSPAFVYHLGNGGSDGGMSFSKAFNILKEHGCATMAEMPYVESDRTSPPSPAAEERARKYRAREIAYLFSKKPDPEKLKSYLYEMHRPFVVAIPIFTDFPKSRVDPDFVYHLSVDPSRSNLTGGHAVTIVGYDEDKKAFRMVNSWGTRWGDHGFLWLGEDFVTDWCFEGWGDVPGGPISRTPPTPHVKIEHSSQAVHTAAK